MKTHDAEIELIKDLLRNNPKGMKISRIGRELAMNRNAAAKFLEILLMTGQVEMLEHGMSKIFILSRRTGIPTMLDLSADFILVIDKDLKIARINDNYLHFCGLNREDIMGKTATALSLPVISEPLLAKKINEAYHGADIKTEVRVVHNNEELFFDVRITPTVFNDGKPGITIILENITEQKKKELSLLESEANFRTLFGESPMGTAVFDATGNLLNANPEFIRNFGVKSHKEIVSVNLFSLPGIPPESLEFLKKNKKVRFESVINLDRTREQGSLVPGKTEKKVLEFKIAPINLNNKGLQPGFIVQVNDGDVQFRNIIDNSQDIIARFSHDLKYLYVNRGIEKIAGVAPEACIGRSNSNLSIPSDTALLWDSVVREVFRTKKSASCEFPLPGKGSIHWYHTRCFPVTGESGEIISVNAVTRDITELKTENPVPDENVRVLEEILSCIDEAVLLIDSRTFRISFANTAAMKVFGYEKRDFSDTDPGVFLGAVGAQIQDYDSMKDAFGTRGFYEIGSVLKRNGGGNFFSRIHIRPVCDDHGNIRNIVAIIREVPCGAGAEKQLCPVMTWNLTTSDSLRSMPAIHRRYGPVI